MMGSLLSTLTSMRSRSSVPTIKVNSLSPHPESTNSKTCHIYLHAFNFNSLLLRPLHVAGRQPMCTVSAQLLLDHGFITRIVAGTKHIEPAAIVALMYEGLRTAFPE